MRRFAWSGIRPSGTTAYAYTYDANGNQTIKTRNGVTTTFVYDVRDQLISVRENTDTLLARLSSTNLKEIVKIAALAMTVRGYGHIKDKAAAAHRKTVNERLEALDRKSPTHTTNAAPLKASA